jgi:putative lipoic acid-binding regulatory protein
MKKIPRHIPGSSCKPRIDYPCIWQYKIIGESFMAIRKVVEGAVADKYFTLTESNVSSSGRYVSMSLELTVHNDEQRLELYRIFAASQEIKVVL